MGNDPSYFILTVLCKQLRDQLPGVAANHSNFLEQRLYLMCEKHPAFQRWKSQPSPWAPVGLTFWWCLEGRWCCQNAYSSIHLRSLGGQPQWPLLGVTVPPAISKVLNGGGRRQGVKRQENLIYVCIYCKQKDDRYSYEELKNTSSSI